MKEKPIWTGLLNECAALKVGESFALNISEALINRFRSMLHISKRTSQWRWTVRKIYRADHAEYRVTKVGLW